GGSTPRSPPPNEPMPRSPSASRTRATPDAVRRASAGMGRVLSGLPVAVQLGHGGGTVVTPASRPPRAICLHGHYYQPPREDPWLGVVEPEPSAAPDRDWNTRITRECYVPCAAARILDARGRLREVLSIYEWTSFDFGPTLLAWLVPHAPEVVAALRRADAAARRRTGHGSAWAQPYAHPILPLASPADVRTQMLWGRRDFETVSAARPRACGCRRWRSTGRASRRSPTRASRSRCSRRTRHDACGPSGRPTTPGAR